MNNQQPDPSPPDFRPVPPPSWLTYFILTATSAILILVAFSIGTPDWSGLLVNLASGIVTAIMFLIIIDRKFRANEFSTLQVKTSTFTTQFASIFSADIADTVGYAKVFANQIRKIRPSLHVERPELENLLEEFPSGFFMSGMAGIGKTTLVQSIAIKYSEQLIVKPKGKTIPVLIPVRNWQSGNIVEQIYKEIDKFYPVRTKVLRNWLRSKPMLLIFDGLNEHTNPDTVMMEIETLRKLANNLIIIVTSRSVPKNSELPKVVLSGFTKQETKRQIELIGSSPEALTEVIEKFHQMTQGHPLANTIAANLAKKSGSTSTQKSK
jgi:hypothetical protein